MKNSHITLTLSVLAFALLCHGETATADLDDLGSREKLTGDWGGVRSDLSKHGIDVGLRLSQYGQWVTSGAVKEEGEYGGAMDYRVNFDGEKLGLWKGFSVNMHARTRFGYDINAHAGNMVLQNAGMLMPSPGGYNNTDITGLILSQNFSFFGGQANVIGGKLDVIDTVTGFFPSIGYGQEGFWNVNSMISGLPWFGAVQGLALYGAVGTTINEEYKIAESGVLFTGTQNESTSWGSISDAYDEGTWFAAFHRFIWGDPDMMGYFMVFGGYSTEDALSNDPHDFIDKPGQGLANTGSKKNPWDVALYLYQDFWRDADNANRKANFMIGGTVGPDNPQFSNYNVFANIEAYGLVESRPNDRMGVGGWYNGLSDNFKELTLPVVDLTDLWGTEIYYNVEINKWLHVSADLQFVQNQHANDDFAVIPGIRMVMDF
jgi:porin